MLRKLVKNKKFYRIFKCCTFCLGDYDQQSMSGRSRNEGPARFFPPNREPAYMDQQYRGPQSYIPTYLPESNIQNGRILENPSMTSVTPYYPGYASPRSLGKVYSLPRMQPTTMENAFHGYQTPSEELNVAFQPLRRTSGVSMGTHARTMTYVSQNRQDSMQSIQGLMRPQSERGSLMPTGTIPGIVPVQSLPKDEVNI